MMVVDIAVIDKNYQLVLTVEVKKFLKMTADWAADYRRNIMEHGTYPIAPYFLLVTPDKFFLWTKTRNGRDFTLPDYTIEADEYLKPHFKNFGTTAEKASPYILEKVVEQWLNSLIYPKLLNGTTKNDQTWIEESGLGKTINNGNIFFDKAE